MTVVDGNALAGILADVFQGDATSMRMECAQCATESMVAQMRVTIETASAVAQCPTCGAVMLDLRGDGAGRRLDVRGVRLLRPGADAG